MKMKRFIAYALLAALAAPVSALAQSAADYPNKTVRIIIPNAPGGPTDAIGRVAAAYLEGRFKQPFVVENRPGASGQVAYDALLKAPGDGYTVAISAQQFIIEQATNKDWPFRYERDLTLISRLASTGYVVVASSKNPSVNLREFVAYSKANPGKLNEGMPGGFNADFAIFRRALGMGPVEFVLFGGMAPAIQAIVSGDVDFTGVVVLPSLVEFEKQGRVKLLAYTGKQRHPLIPHVPTANEANVGLNDYELTFWVAMIAPSSTPPDVVSRLSAAVSGMAGAPEVTSKIKSLGLDAEMLSPADSRARIAAQYRQYQDAVAAGQRMR